MIRRFVFAALFLVTCASHVHAQTATPTSKFAIDQAGPDLTTVQAYTFKTYADGSVTGTVITMTCSGTVSPFVCTAPIPAFTQGPHSVTFSASNAAGESAKSTAVPFTMVIIPSTPANPRIQ